MRGVNAEPKELNNTKVNHSVILLSDSGSIFNHNCFPELYRLTKKKVEYTPKFQRKTEVMAEDTSRRRMLEPVGMAPLHKSPSQHLMRPTHAALLMQCLVTRPQYNEKNIQLVSTISMLQKNISFDSERQSI